MDPPTTASNFFIPKDSMNLAIPIATALNQSPQAIAFHEVGRQAIKRDPYWNKGNYYKKKAPVHGLSVARMLSHITYMSEESLWEKFGRNLQDKNALDFNFDIEFQVESYLNYQGLAFTKRFDANSYLYITKALDYFDLGKGRKSVDEAFEKTTAKCLVISLSSDWLYTPEDNLKIVSALRANNIDTSYIMIETKYGHDAFLIKNRRITNVIKSFINNFYEENFQ
jgi:homoserine O-acetyltransferase